MYSFLSFSAKVISFTYCRHYLLGHFMNFCYNCNKWCCWWCSCCCHGCCCYCFLEGNNIQIRLVVWYIKIRPSKYYNLLKSVSDFHRCCFKTGCCCCCCCCFSCCCCWWWCWCCWCCHLSRPYCVKMFICHQAVLITF